MCIYHKFHIHYSIEGHLYCFHVLAILNSATINIGGHVSFSTTVSSGCMPRSGIARSYGRCSPKFLRNLDFVFHSDCISLHSQSVKGFPFFPHPLQHLFFCSHFDDGHSYQSEMIPHCSLDVHYSNNEQC